MATALLNRMARNPAGDWTMADVRNVCARSANNFGVLYPVLPLLFLVIGVAELIAAL